MHIDSDLVLSEPPIQQCKVGGRASNLIMVKMTLSLLLRYSSLGTNPDRYALLSSGVALISTPKQNDYMNYFPKNVVNFSALRCLMYWHVKMFLSHQVDGGRVDGGRASKTGKCN